MTAQIHYRIGWRSRTVFPGGHASTQSGGGLEFSHHAALLDASDPRRIDLHASLKDPFENWQVRRFRQRSGISVYVLADLSASMGFAGRLRKLDALADLTLALAYSAHRSGDRFGFFGCDETLRADWFMPASQQIGTGIALSQRLRSFVPTGTHARGLLDACSHLTRQRSLIFLVSDFHFSLELLDQILAGLTQHQVVPIVLWDRAELEAPARWGLARLRDSESQRRRFVFLTPRFGADLERLVAQRRRQLAQRFMLQQTKPLFLLDGFRTDDVTAYFHTDAPVASGAAVEHGDPVAAYV
jgi:uncharacterized protein (DUF58 family)